MKTDRFDDEFRHKLLGLPADIDPGEVDRVHTHVQTHLPATPGVSWGKLIIYGGAGLLLIASLTYNFIQSYRNTHLLVSFDSLAHMSSLTENVRRHDTVYVTRPLAEKATVDKSLSTKPMPSLHDERYGHLSGKPTKRNPAPMASELIEPATLNPGTQTLQPAAVDRLDANRAPADSVSLVDRLVHEAATVVENSALASPKAAAGSRRIIYRKHATDPLTLKTVEPTTGNKTPANQATWIGQTSSASPTPSPRLYRTNSVASTSGDKRSRFSSSGRQVQGKTPRSDERITPLESTMNPDRQPVEQLASRPFDKVTPFAKTLSAYRVAVFRNVSTAAKKSHQGWHLSLPSLSVPNAQYRLGGGLTGGVEDQISGALLGEIAFNSHWSLQAGVRALYSQGFNYRNERDFNDHQTDDFRQLYASQLPLTSAIDDIQLTSVIAQVPIQVAYQYTLSKQWRLRLGVGTDLDIWGRSVVSYKYQGNGRSSERGLTTVEPSIHWFNNITIHPAVEWYRKRWLLRAGPYISPQLRTVSYKPDDLSWGAHVQIMYQLGK